MHKTGGTRPPRSRRRIERAWVVRVEPAQGVGRAVAGSGPFGVARLLRRAVWHVEAGLVGARQFLQPGDARQAELLIALERRRRIAVARGNEAAGEGGAVLDRLRRALSHERVYRVARIAEQRRAPDRPARQRVAIEQGPDEAGIGSGDDPADLRMPALERGERPGDRRAVGPVLAVPGVVLGPADEIEEAPARDRVVHEMPAGADPGLVAEFEPEIGDALGGHQPAIGDAAGKARRLLAEQLGAHRRVDAVGADQHVARDPRAVFEPCRDFVALLSNPHKPLAEMDPLGGEARCDRRQKIGAVNGDVRRAIERFALRVERRLLQGAPVLPAALVGAERADALAVETWPEAEPPQHARRIRTHVDAAADLRQLGRLFVDLDGEPGLVQRHGGAEAAKAAADNRGVEPLALHLTTRRPQIAGRIIDPQLQRVEHGIDVGLFDRQRAGLSDRGVDDPDITAPPWRPEPLQRDAAAPAVRELDRALGPALRAARHEIAPSDTAPRHLVQVLEIFRHVPEPGPHLAVLVEIHRCGQLVGIEDQGIGFDRQPADIEAQQMMRDRAIAAARTRIASGGRSTHETLDRWAGLAFAHGTGGDPRAVTRDLRPFILLDPHLSGLRREPRWRRAAEFGALENCCGSGKRGRRKRSHCYAAQANGAKCPLLPWPAISRSRPNAWIRVSLDRAKARRRPAGCPTLSR